MPVVLAPILDAVVVVVFAAVGRRNHGEGEAFIGVLSTAWPFAVGAMIGWALLLVRGRGPATGGSLPSGVVVWLSTVVVGMVLRHLSGRGVAVSFVVVTLIFTGVFMLGWRAIASTANRRAQRGA